MKKRNQTHNVQLHVNEILENKLIVTERRLMDA